MSQQLRSTINKNIYMIDSMNLGKRIESRLTELGWQRGDLLSRVPALSPQSLSALITRDSRRSEHDVAIAAALGVNLLWLVAGEGEKLAGHNSQTASDNINIRLSPMVRDPHLACILPVNKGLSISKAWMSALFPNLPDTSDLCLVPVSGYGMAPTFGAGDLLLVDQSVRAVGEDGIYLVKIGDKPARPRRLQESPDGSVLILSDNPQYQPAIVPPENLDQMHIHGRALYAWTGKRL